jgi:hypothetical protein
VACVRIFQELNLGFEVQGHDQRNGDGETERKEELQKECIKTPSSGMAACVDGDIAPPQLTPLLDHFREQRTVNPVFFAEPIRSLRVQSLAALIEPRLTRAARAAGTRPPIPQSLIALMVAEMQISLITHWLAGRFSLK